MLLLSSKFVAGQQQRSVGATMGGSSRVPAFDDCSAGAMEIVSPGCPKLRAADAPRT